ncbi:MAG: hypothetical protein QCI38_09140, partial [Candidatus Thermoplasmatota archaeon]|nr:hypothetical protein [Candidatus Thermoplasmatota archaeon]
MNRRVGRTLAFVLVVFAAFALLAIFSSLEAQADPNPNPNAQANAAENAAFTSNDQTWTYSDGNLEMSQIEASKLDLTTPGAANDTNYTTYAALPPAPTPGTTQIPEQESPEPTTSNQPNPEKTNTGSTSPEAVKESTSSPEQKSVSSEQQESTDDNVAV